MFPNLTKNDQLPLFSSVFPYSFLSNAQKEGLRNSDYTHIPARFRLSASGYRQSANRARDLDRNAIFPGDINGRWNILGLFYDKPLRDELYKVLGITQPTGDCQLLIENSQFSDPNKEFGFFSIPLLYRKYGARFESEILLVNDCFYAVGFMVQWGINDIRQTVKSFNDMSFQALGTSAPTGPRGASGTECAAPAPQVPAAVAPPFATATTAVPPCSPDPERDCAIQQQTFQPCCDGKLCFSFPAECKQIVIRDIMSQRDKIAHFLGRNICDYHKIGLDDLRLSGYWRHIFVINEDDASYPRVLFMPFLQLGFGIPMMEEINNTTMFALPNDNNHHTFVGGRTGFTLDFLDTIDIYASAGFSYFFKRQYPNLPLPTIAQESGIYPYTADAEIRPGPTWAVNFGMHAHDFLENLSAWVEYAIVSHAEDKISVCRSFIPQSSAYFEKGFDVARAECESKWESHLVNVGFNYDLFRSLSLGIALQIPAKQRNVYRSGTVLGTLSFVF